CSTGAYESTGSRTSRLPWGVSRVPAVLPGFIAEVRCSGVPLSDAQVTAEVRCFPGVPFKRYQGSLPKSDASRRMPRPQCRMVFEDGLPAAEWEEPLCSCQMSISSL
ncbi:hypothetical protein AVEN_215418-1, partial [Araneus ventricosus]